MNKITMAFLFGCCIGIAVALGARMADYAWLADCIPSGKHFAAGKTYSCTITLD